MRRRGADQSSMRPPGHVPHADDDDRVRRHYRNREVTLRVRRVLIDARPQDVRPGRTGEGRATASPEASRRGAHCLRGDRHRSSADGRRLPSHQGRLAHPARPFPAATAPPPRPLQPRLCHPAPTPKPKPTPAASATRMRPPAWHGSGQRHRSLHGAGTRPDGHRGRTDAGVGTGSGPAARRGSDAAAAHSAVAIAASPGNGLVVRSQQRLCAPSQRRPAAGHRGPSPARVPSTLVPGGGAGLPVQCCSTHRKTPPWLCRRGWGPLAYPSEIAASARATIPAVLPTLVGRRGGYDGNGVAISARSAATKSSRSDEVPAQACRGSAVATLVSSSVASSGTPGPAPLDVERRCRAGAASLRGPQV